MRKIEIVDVHILISFIILVLLTANVFGLRDDVQVLRTTVHMVEEQRDRIEVLKDSVRLRDELIDAIEKTMLQQSNEVELLRKKVDALQTSGRINRIYRTMTKKQAYEVVLLADKYARLRGLDTELVLSIIAAESSFNSNAHNEYGAVGLMQVVPRWHHDKLKGRDAFNKEVNIDVGTQVLAEYIARYNGDVDKALAKYNGASTAAKADVYLSSIALNMSKLFKDTGPSLAGL